MSNQPAHTAAVKRQALVWRQMLTDLHPKAMTAAEGERIALVESIFQREARASMMILLSELDRAWENEDWLAKDLRETQRKLTEANRLLKEAREKNKKLRTKK